MRRFGRPAAVRQGLILVILATLCSGATPLARAQDGALMGAAMLASGGEPVLLREQPGYDAAALATLGEGAALDVAGPEVVDAAGQAWLPVVVDGQSGYVPSGYVVPGAAAPAPASEEDTTLTDPAAAASAVEDVASAADPLSAMPDVAGAATTTEANLRAAPSTDADVLTVLPPGTALSIDGEASNGFVPVTGIGVTGWVAVELLQTAAPDAAPVTAADPALPEPIVADSAEMPATSAEAAASGKRRESTGIAWPMSGGTWEVVQGYNNGTHTNRSDFAQYQYSLDWARADGNTAGQTVYAPVSGAIEWVDRGSGGMLIDAGNGYGVALFHVTYDRGYSSGDRVERGEAIGSVSGPGGDGYESMSHIDMTCWRLTQNGHASAPFDGPNAIAGQEFPDIGGGNQYMGATASP